MNQTILSRMGAKNTGDGWKREWDAAKAELLALAQAPSSSPYHTQDTAQGCHSAHTWGRRMVRLQQGHLVPSLTKVCSMIFKCQINCCQIWKW